MGSDGSMTTETKECDDWNEMKEELAVSAKELHATTKALIGTLTDVPPPGQVALGDLSSEFARFEGKVAFDFLRAGATESNVDGFAYVRVIGDSGRMLGELARQLGTLRA